MRKRLIFVYRRGETKRANIAPRQRLWQKGRLISVCNGAAEMTGGGTLYKRYEGCSHCRTMLIYRLPISCQSRLALRVSSPVRPSPPGASNVLNIFSTSQHLAFPHFVVIRPQKDMVNLSVYNRESIKSILDEICQFQSSKTLEINWESTGVSVNTGIASVQLQPDNRLGVQFQSIQETIRTKIYNYRRRKQRI